MSEVCKEHGKASQGAIGRWGRRVFWYSLATILLLALPTFSDLRPRVANQFDRLMDGMGLPRVGSAQTFPGSPSSTSLAAAAVANPPRPSRFVGSFPAGREGAVTAVGRGLPDSGAGRAELAAATGLPAASTRVLAEAVQGGAGAASTALAEMMGELHRMESDYHALASSLFPAAQGLNFGFSGGLAANPFAEALAGGGGQAADPPPNGGSGNSGDGNNQNPSGGGGSGSGGQNPEPPNNPPPNTDPGTGEPEPEPGLSSGFLVLGPYGPDRDSLAFLGTRLTGGRILLETGLELDFFPGVVGPGRPSFIIEEGRQCVTADVLSDGVQDLFVTQEAMLGTALFGHRMLGGTILQQWAFGFFLYDRVLGFAPFDVDGDGREELVAITARSSNLQVFRLQNGELQYSRELTLPLAPGLLAASRDPVRKTQSLLQVFDRNLKNWVTFDSRYPGVYSFARPNSLKSIQDVIVPFAAGGFTRQFRVVHYADRLVVAELTDTGYRFLGSFELGARLPTILIGDQLSNGTQQVVFLP